MAARSMWRANTKLLLTATVGGGAAFGPATIAKSEDSASALKLSTAVPLRLFRHAFTAATMAFDYEYSFWGLADDSIERAKFKCEVHTWSSLKLQELCFRNGGIYIKLWQYISQLEYLYRMNMSRNETINV